MKKTHFPIRSKSFAQQTFVLMKTSWRRLEDAFRLRFRGSLNQDEHIHLKHTSSEDVLIKTNIFVLVIRLQDVFKTFSRCLAKTSSKLLQDVFKTSSRRFQDVFKMSSRLLAKASTRCLWDVFKRFLRRSPKTVIYRRICLGHTSEKFMVSVQNFPEWQEVSQILVSYFTTLFSGCLQRLFRENT